MRKRATEGTKISTSLTITKKIVRTKSRAERLRTSILAPSAEARQEADEAAGARREQGRRIEAPGGALAGFAPGRVGHDQISHRANLEPLRNRQSPGHDQIAGRRTEDRRAENAPPPAGDDLHFARCVALGVGAVVFGK